jgi:metacaspase-1
MGDFAGKAQQLIPANVRMISGCEDSQTSADVSNVSEFQLPDPAGRSGGACTSALLKVLYNEHHKNEENLSFVDVLTRMRQVLSSGRYTQIPQLTSSRKMDVHEKFDIVPDIGQGRRRAIMIGINYVGQQGQLSGCHNDVGNMKDYIMNAHGFREEDIVVLMDDGCHTSPTYENIIGAFRKLVSETQAGDCAFLHYSGEPIVL